MPPSSQMRVRACVHGTAVKLGGGGGGDVVVVVVLAVPFCRAALLPVLLPALRWAGGESFHLYATPRFAIA